MAKVGVKNFSRFNDIILAILVMMIISLMIIPIPPAVLDCLLAVNLTLSVMLLMLKKQIKHLKSWSLKATID